MKYFLTPLITFFIFSLLGNKAFASDLLTQANQAFAQNNFATALNLYQEALKDLRQSSAQVDNDDKWEDSDSNNDSVTVNDTPLNQIGSPTATPGSGLVQNVLAAPNVSNGQQSIHLTFNLNHTATVRLSIFNLVGEQVFNTSTSGNAGINSLVWEVKNMAHESVASGLYIYTIQVDDGSNHQNVFGKIAIIR